MWACKQLACVLHEHCNPLQLPHKLSVSVQLSVLIIWVVTGILVYEAVLRIIHPERVDGKLMFILAMSGIAVNLINLAVLGGHHGHSHGHEHSHSQEHGHSHGHAHSHGHSHAQGHGHRHGHSHAHSHGHSQAHGHGQRRQTAAAEVNASGHHKTSDTANPCQESGHAHHHSLVNPTHELVEGVDNAERGQAAANARSTGLSHMSLGMQGAVIHVMGDCIQSFGVVIAAIIIWVKPEYHIADPICTFIFAIAVICTTRGMVRDIIDIVMERVPRGFDLPGLEQALSHVPGVVSTHDLHVWALKPGVVVLAVHIDITADSSPAAVLRLVTACCSAAGIHHSTVQLTAEGEACPCNTLAVKQVITAGPHLH